MARWEYIHQNVTERDTAEFRCQLDCAQCAAKTAKGAQCKRTTCKFMPYCTQHIQTHLGVRVDSSKALPGEDGLFATRSFAKGDMIAPYAGQHVTDDQVETRYGTGPTALAPYLVGEVDAACRRGIASQANGYFGVVSKNKATHNGILHKTSSSHDASNAKGNTYSYEEEDGRGKKQKHSLKLTRENLGIQWWAIATKNIKSGDEIILKYGTGYPAAYRRRAAECAKRGLRCDQTVKNSRGGGRASSKAKTGASAKRKAASKKGVRAMGKRGGPIGSGAPRAARKSGPQKASKKSAPAKGKRGAPIGASAPRAARKSTG